MKLSERLERVKQVNNMQDDSFGFVDLMDQMPQVDEFENLKADIHRDVIDVYNKEIQQNNGKKDDIDVRAIIEDLLSLKGEALTRIKREQLVQEIYDDVTGLGPLEKLLRDEDISEIMVNGPKQIYVEKKGRIELSPIHFRDNAHVSQIINRIVSPLGRRCDEANPMVDARLEDGSRVNAIVPPVALNGPTLTIRKFNSTPLQVEDLIEFNSLSFQMAAFLKACVVGRTNMMVSGGTGSGKTTLLNVLSSFIPATERIVTIEDAAELQLMQDHVVTLEARPENVEGKGEVAIRDLVKNSLRMRPDRIIVGEVRSGEALDMLQAMNTGHDGSLATGHANSPRDLVARLETMVMMAGMDLPIKAIREQIASAIDIIVQQTRLRDGS
ncbi:MAG TPA: CpaF family protein, partial [Tissierellaceae bacterium]